jgi:hypothetical protein
LGAVWRGRSRRASSSLRRDFSFLSRRVLRFDIGRAPSKHILWLVIAFVSGVYIHMYARWDEMVGCGMLTFQRLVCSIGGDSCRPRD